MKLALVLGINQGNVVKPKLQEIKDNLEIDCYADISQFIDSALKRSCIYDRILILSTMLNNTVSEKLYDYWSSTSKDTQIVLMCRKDSDEELAKQFLNMFMTPVVAVMLVTTTTVSIIAEAVLRPTYELTQDYGIKDYLSVEFDDDSVSVQQPINNVIANKASEATQTEEVMKPKKKRTLLSVLFGNKGDSANSQEPASDSTNDNISRQFEEQSVEQVDYNLDVCSQNNESFDLDIEDASSSNYSYEDTTNDVEISDYTSQFSDSDNFENSNFNSDNQSLVVDDTTESDFYEDDFDNVVAEVNDFAPKGDIDEDFGSEIDTYSAPKTRVVQKTEVDEDLSGLDLSSEEESYRTTTEAPKVITKTVVKEVVRNIGDTSSGKKSGSKTPTLTGVYEGRYRKTIIVTGDRCTGITSTALNIAKYLSKKVSVLYFDCDIYNHGVLNYIDYARFSNYESVHHNGIKMCKSNVAFNSCVISYDTNFDLLTTDFSCDATVEELRVAHEVVAENLDNYQVTIVDCPIDCLQYVPEFLMSGNTVLCVEGSKRGFMNMLCRLESNSLSTRYKKNIVARGMMFVTKCPQSLDLNKLVKHLKAVFESNGVDWLSMPLHKFNGQLDDTLLNNILEG